MSYRNQHLWKTWYPWKLHWSISRRNWSSWTNQMDDWILLLISCFAHYNPSCVLLSLQWKISSLCIDCHAWSNGWTGPWKSWWQCYHRDHPWLNNQNQFRYGISSLKLSLYNFLLILWRIKKSYFSVYYLCILGAEYVQ